MRLAANREKHMSETDRQEAQLSPVLVALFRGVLYEEAGARIWQDMLALQGRVRDYVGLLGLELILDEAEGYAYLRQAEPEENGLALPRLVPRRQLSYPVSLLLALLRKKLAEHDASGGDPRLILTREQIVDTVRLFLPESSDEARLLDRIDAHIGRVTDMGFLRPLNGQQGRYEVRRIIKAFIDAQWLGEFDQRLRDYREHLSTDS